MFDQILAIKERFSSGWIARSSDELREETETARAHRRMVGAMWVALVLLAFFNSAGALRFAQTAAPGPVQETMTAMAMTWDNEMQRHGFGSVKAGLSDWFDGLRAASWDDARMAAEDIRSDVERTIEGRAPQTEGTAPETD